MTRGDIYQVSLDPIVGSEIGKTRPAVVLQNDLANKTSSTVTIVPISSKLRRVYPFQVKLSAGDSGLERNSKALCEQIRTISRERLLQKLGHISQESLDQIRTALNRHLWF